MNECIIVYYPEDRNAPLNVKFMSVEEGRARRQRLQQQESAGGAWKLHMVGEAFE